MRSSSLGNPTSRPNSPQVWQQTLAAAFKEKHTAQDIVEIVRAGSVQQMGDQVLSLARELGGMNLSQPRTAHQSFFPLPFILLVHYPEAWTVPLFLVAMLLMVAMFVIAFRKRLITWR